jgi:hypothetical protein
MSAIAITIGRELAFSATLEVERAPRTCEAFLTLLPLERRIIHARWSGEAMWVPLGEGRFVAARENLTSHPAPGQLLWYPGGISEPEILVPYGAAIFSSKVGLLPGTHFLTITGGLQALRAAGETTLWKGAQDVVIAVA